MPSLSGKEGLRAELTAKMMHPADGEIKGMDEVGNREHGHDNHRARASHDERSNSSAHRGRREESESDLGQGGGHQGLPYLRRPVRHLPWCGLPEEPFNVRDGVSLWRGLLDFETEPLPPGIVDGFGIFPQYLLDNTNATLTDMSQERLAGMILAPRYFCNHGSRDWGSD